MPISTPGIESLEPRIAPAFGAVVDLATLNGNNGFSIVGASERDYAGVSVSAAGDINGDGFDDIIVGAQLAATSVPYSGATYVIFGKAGGFGASLNLAALNGANGFRISGVATYDYAGTSVRAAGDVNGDGFDDIVIGAYYSDVGGQDSGAAYVVFGKGSGFAANLNLSALDGSNGFTIPGAAPGQRFGFIVAGAGDINGDGFDEIVVGAPYTTDAGLTNAGAAYVVFGKSAPFAPVIPLTSLDGNNGFRITGTAYGDHFAKAVTGGGDFNGDGFDDLMFCAPFADPVENSEGITYVLFGKPTAFAADMDAASIASAGGFTLTGTRVGDNAGKSLAFADINKDGFDDAFLGGYGPSGDTGAVYVFYGRAGAVPSALSLTTIDGINGFVITGRFALGDFAASLSSAGDVNGDGFEDVIIGEPRADDESAAGVLGAAHVVYGRSSPFPTSLSVTALDGTNGFWLRGIADGSRSGFSVSAGDIDQDGFTDLVIGAYRHPDNSSRNGTTLVVYAQPLNGVIPDISVNDVSIAEGPVGTRLAEFTVSLSATSASPISVIYETAASSALAGVDFISIAPTMLTFAPGEITRTIVVDIVGDFQVEGNESFFLNLRDATNATIADSQGLGTLLNDDALVQVSSGGSTVILSDVDGDSVIIKTTRGKLSAANVVFGPDGAIQTIDLLQDQRFAGANISITAKTLGGVGNGRVDVPLLDATDVDLGAVKISGNLGRIVVGDGNDSRLALKSLTVASLGTDEQLDEPLVSEFAGAVGKLTVKGDVRGAAVDVQGRVGRATIGGNLRGDINAGAIILEAIEAGRFIDPRVGGGIPTGAFNCAGMSAFNVRGEMNGGAVTSSGDIGGVTVGRDLSGAAIAAAGQIRNVKVFGTMSGGDPDKPVVVAALAQVAADKLPATVAINSLQVRGDMENAQVLLGYQKRDSGDNPGRYLARNPDASAGKIVVNGDWIASSLVAGVFDTGRDGFGQNDALIAGDTTANISARIASIVISGTARGTPESGDHYGITAQKIGLVSIGGVRVVLDPGNSDNVLVDTVNADFRIVEV